MNGEIYFEAVCPETYKDIYQFQKFGIWHNAAYIIFLILAILYDILMCITDAAGGTPEFIPIRILLMIILLIIPELSARFVSKKTMRSPIHINNVNRYLFYQDGFVNIDNFSRAEIYYGQLMKAYETDYYFYLFVEDHRAYVISKKGFVYNTPQEMRKLLQIKLGRRFFIKAKV